MERLITNTIYRFMFESSFDAILLTHPDGHVYRANPAACEMFQRTEEEICQLGRPCVADINDPRLEPALEERLKLGKVRTELNFKRKDGTIFPTECSSTIFKDEQGEVWSVIIVRDMSLIKSTEDSLRKAHEEAKSLAAHDYLTGTLNRREFMDRLERELNRSKREGTPLSLILLDIDHFKMINDTYGHVYGDEVLKRAVKCLVNSLRPYDIFGRYGGDEFIACLPNTTLENALIVAQRLRGQIENTNLSCTDDRVCVTISLGVACHDNDSTDDSNGLIQRADKNLYMAKFDKNTVYGM